MPINVVNLAILTLERIVIDSCLEIQVDIRGTAVFGICVGFFRLWWIRQLEKKGNQYKTQEALATLFNTLKIYIGAGDASG